MAAKTALRSNAEISVACADYLCENRALVFFWLRSCRVRGLSLPGGRALVWAAFAAVQRHATGAPL
jgi:hypothetical protein